MNVKLLLLLLENKLQNTEHLKSQNGLVLIKRKNDMKVKKTAEQSFQDQRMEQEKQNTCVMKDIVRSSKLLSHVDVDYSTKCIEFSESHEFGSKTRKQDAVEIVHDLQNCVQFCAMF